MSSALLSTAPALVIILGGLLAAILPHGLRHAFALVVIAVSAWGCWQIDPATIITAKTAGFEVITLRSLAYTKAFAMIFHIAAALGVIYALGVDKHRATIPAAMVYAGCAIAALYKGDFLGLFIYWEVMSFASVLLILAANTKQSFNAAMRYLMMQLLSGVLLLGGAVLLWQAQGSFKITPLAPTSLAGAMILAAFGIKAAFPLLNAWVQDAYTAATPAGRVILSAFTTKLAVYMLLVCFTASPALVPIGVAMAVLGVCYTAGEKDLRRLLAFSLNAQLGFMVAGVGIGTALAVNGVVAHAFASVIYQALLFMGVGVMVSQNNTARFSWTALLTIIGAASISSIPLFSGFATKSLTIASVLPFLQTELLDWAWVWLGLMFATAGTFIFTGVRLALAVINAEIKTNTPTLIAMAFAAVLCLGIGIYSPALYALLPYEVAFNVWDAPHLIRKTEMLIFAALTFAIIVWRGWLPLPDKILLNSDWFYRAAAPRLVGFIFRPAAALWQASLSWSYATLKRLTHKIEEMHERSNLTSGASETGIAAGVVLAVLALTIALRYFL